MIFGLFLFENLNYPTICIQETKNNFREWTLVVQEIVRFMKVETAFMNVRPLRYCNLFDSYPSSIPYVARFHAKKMLKFRDALLASYHRNEVNGFRCSCDLSLLLISVFNYYKFTVQKGLLDLFTCHF